MCDVSQVFGLEIWQLLMVAEVVGVTTIRNVQSVTQFALWIAQHPEDLPTLLECSRVARENPAAWTTVRLMMRRPVDETLSGAS